MTALAFAFALAVVVGALYAVNALLAPLADVVADDINRLMRR